MISLSFFITIIAIIDFSYNYTIGVKAIEDSMWTIKSIFFETYVGTYVNKKIIKELLPGLIFRFIMIIMVIPFLYKWIRSRAIDGNCSDVNVEKIG